MAEETVAVATPPQNDKKGLLWFLSEMNLWSLWERYTSAMTPVEAYDPERLARLRKTATTVGAGEAMVLAAGIPAIYACLNGLLHPFAGELSYPWNHLVFGLVTLWPLLITTTMIWWSIPKIEGDITAMIAKNFALLRGLILVIGVAVAAAIETLVPIILSPESIYSCYFIPKALAIKGYAFWSSLLTILIKAAPWVLAIGILIACLGLLPVLLKTYYVLREKETYEKIRGEV